MKRKVIITAAVNGAAPRKALNPAVPEQPAEIAQAARECYDAGASIVHFHIRGPQGAPACSADILNNEIDGEIRALSPIIIQASTAPLRDVEESLELFQAKNLPEMMTVAFGLMHLSTPKGDTLYPCTRSFLRRFLLEMRSHGVKPELELLSGASADDALELLEQKSVGYVGSRTVSEEDIDFVRQTLAKTVGWDYLVVSGGAKGADSVAMEEALVQGGGCIAYLSDSMDRRLKQSRTVMPLHNFCMASLLYF